MPAHDPVPAVAPVSGPRPLLSVMIPAYESGPYLKETLAGILAQDYGRGAMQIAVVDDASPTADIEALLPGLAPPGRIEVHRNPGNLGLAGNWNRCIALARGEFVHLLHQDDVVLPGFYAHLLRGLRDSQAGMAFCRHDFIDPAGQRTRRSHRERWRAGILRAWLDRISERQRIQCPAAIVRRAVYEQVGGFRADLSYALDWEMWVRIAARYRVWYDPEVLAHYRRHGLTATARLDAAGHASPDTLAAIGIFAAHLPPGQREGMMHRAYRRLVRSHLRRAARLLKAGSPQLASIQIDSASAALSRLPDNVGTRWRRNQLRRLAVAAARPASSPASEQGNRPSSEGS